MCHAFCSGAKRSGDRAAQFVVPDQAEFAALLSRGRGGSQEAIVEAVELALPFARAAARHARRRSVLSNRESDDRQSLHLAALTHIDRFAGKTFAEFAGWLTAILTNQRIDSIRSDCAGKRGGGRVEYLAGRDVVDPVVQRKGIDPVASEAIERENRERLLSALAGLSERERTIIELHFLYGLPFKFIGQALQESADAVRMASSRTLKKLRRTLGDEHDGGWLAVAS